jgi:hypothetical protein
MSAHQDHDALLQQLKPKGGPKTTGEDESDYGFSESHRYHSTAFSDDNIATQPLLQRRPIDRNHKHEELDLLSNLQLPRMPESLQEERPALRILVVADVDLQSTSALAEYALWLQNDENAASIDATDIGGGNVDMVIACGPLVRNDDLVPYLNPRARKRLQQQQQQQQHSDRRTPELEAAMEGVITACLAQLETIACRLVFVPNARTDPLATQIHTHHHWTPNSRNVHQQWLPLAPGLGCAGSAYGMEEGQERTMDDRIVTEDDRATTTIQDLLQLAKPSSVPATNPQEDEIPFLLPQCQSILIKPAASSCCCVENDVRVPLHICPFLHDDGMRPGNCVKGATHVVFPGSLRQAGEYCLIDLALYGVDKEDDIPLSDHDGEFSPETSTTRRYYWKVDQVLFERMR